MFKRLDRLPIELPQPDQPDANAAAAVADGWRIWGNVNTKQLLISIDEFSQQKEVEAVL